MEYIKEKGKGISMQNKKINIIKIHETMTEGVHYKFSTHGPDVVSHTPGSYKGIEGSSMFTMTIRPVGGLMEFEVDKITNFILNAPFILYYSMGLEVVGKTKERDSLHLTVHFVTRGMITGKVSAVDGMKSIFVGLLDDARITSVKNKDGKLCGTILIKSCSKNHMPTKTALTHCPYPLKDAVKGKRREDLTEADYNNGKTHWTNLFDGEKKCTDDEKEQWQMNRIAFHHLLVEEEKKKKHNAPFIIHPRTQNEQASKYAFDNGLDWAPESHAQILATMVVDKLGEKKFMLATTGFFPRSIHEALWEKSWQEDYKDVVEQTLRKYAIKRAKGLGGLNAPSKQEKKLLSQHEKLMKKYAKLEKVCKGHLFTIENNKRKDKGKAPLEDPTKTSTYMINNSISSTGCCVCSGSKFKVTHRCLVVISPCNHKYCTECIELQLDNNTIDCSHCNLNAIKNGTRLKEHWCKRFRETREREQQREQRASKKRRLDTDNISVQEQKRNKMLKAIDSRSVVAVHQ